MIENSILNIPFSGRVGLLTGASSGVGKALAVELARKGAELHLVGRRMDVLKRLVEEELPPAAVAHCHKVDLMNAQDVQALGKRLKADLSGLDYLIHSAGVISLGSLEHSLVEDFDRQYATNVRGCYLLTQELLPLLQLRQSHVLLINSTVGLQAARGNAGQYTATKLALRALADSLRDEVNACGIRVQTVFLGRTATPMQEDIHRQEGKEYHPDQLVQPDEVAKLLVGILQLVHSAEVTDLTIRPFVKPADAPASRAEFDSFFVRDADGTIHFWNKGAERLYGWRSEETLGQSSHQLLRTRFPKSLDLILDELLETGSWRGELVHTRRNGTEVRVVSRWELDRSSTDRPMKVLERNSMVSGLARAEKHVHEIADSVERENTEQPHDEQSERNLQ